MLLYSKTKQKMGDIDRLSSPKVTEVMECLLKGVHRPVEMDGCGTEVMLQLAHAVSAVGDP